MLRGVDTRDPLKGLALAAAGIILRIIFHRVGGAQTARPARAVAIRAGWPWLAQPTQPVRSLPTPAASGNKSNTISYIASKNNNSAGCNNNDDTVGAEAQGARVPGRGAETARPAA